jgi:hypothetical protein
MKMKTKTSSKPNSDVPLVLVCQRVLKTESNEALEDLVDILPLAFKRAELNATLVNQTEGLVFRLLFLAKGVAELPPASSSVVLASGASRVHLCWQALNCLLRSFPEVRDATFCAAADARSQAVITKLISGTSRILKRRSMEIALILKSVVLLVYMYVSSRRTQRSLDDTDLAQLKALALRVMRKAPDCVQLMLPMALLLDGDHTSYMTSVYTWGMERHLLGIMDEVCGTWPPNWKSNALMLIGSGLRNLALHAGVNDRDIVSTCQFLKMRDEVDRHSLPLSLQGRLLYTDDPPSRLGSVLSLAWHAQFTPENKQEVFDFLLHALVNLPKTWGNHRSRSTPLQLHAVLIGEHLAMHKSGGGGGGIDSPLVDALLKAGLVPAFTFALAPGDGDGDGDPERIEALLLPLCELCQFPSFRTVLASQSTDGGKLVDLLVKLGHEDNRRLLTEGASMCLRTLMNACVLPLAAAASAAVAAAAPSSSLFPATAAEADAEAEAEAEVEADAAALIATVGISGLTLGGSGDSKGDSSGMPFVIGLDLDSPDPRLSADWARRLLPDWDCEGSHCVGVDVEIDGVERPSMRRQCMLMLDVGGSFIVVFGLPVVPSKTGDSLYGRSVTGWKRSPGGQSLVVSCK